jgi:glycosyltransferase involved in cell wall biosynthesis
MRIVFVTLNAYDILTGGHGENPGGAQVQQVLIGRHLAKRGHDVYFLEHSTERKDETTIDGINVVLKPKPVGNAFRRAVTASVGTIRALKDIEPDTCYLRVFDFEMLPIAAYCRWTNTRFVYGFSHDTEVTDNPSIFTGLKQTRWYLRLNDYALNSADALIAQNEYQYERAVKRYSTDVYLIPNGYPIPPENPTKWDGSQRPIVLWVARFRPIKQPSLVIKIADEVPSADFVMVGSRDDRQLYERVKSAAESRENIFIEGYVPFDKIDDYFREAAVFLNTSESEGFPNTFLEAWANHTPVFSLNVDPNNALQENQIGYHSDGSISAISDKFTTVFSDPQTIQEYGKKAFEYFVENHSIDRITDQHESVFSTDSDE